MKKTLLLAVLAIFSTCAFAQFSISYKTIVPTELRKYKLGMTNNDFKEQFLITEEEDIMSFRIVYDIKNKKWKNIDEVTLYFDKEAPQPLYEFIINYKTTALRDKFVSQYYGEPNDGDEWRWEMPDGHTAKAWIFGKTLVIAVAYPNTEWVGEWEE